MPVNIIIDSKFDDKGIRDAQNQLKNFAGQAAKRVAQVGAAVAAAGAVAAGKLAVDAVQAASDFEESVNAVNVSFGEAAQGVLKIGENAAQSMGLSQNEFNQAATRFSAFAETVVGEGGNVAGFIGDISQRAADFASVFNIDVSEALQVFQSGLAGEAEPLKRFGINLLQSEVAAFAMANGIASSAAEMTEAQKVQARYGLLLESTAKTQGDFQNTSDSLANSQRILRAEIENLQIEIGSALIPVAKDLVNTFAAALLPRLEDFGRWIQSDEGIAAVREFGDGLVAVFEAALDFGGWIADNLQLLANIGVAIAALTAGIYAYQAATVVATVATQGLATAFKMTPIGALVGLLAGVTTLVGGLAIANQEATPTQAELADEIERTKDELAFYREEQGKTQNTKLYESTIADLEKQLKDLQEQIGENVRFTQESVIQTDRAREAALENRIANQNLKPALTDTGDAYYGLATAATNARLGIESVTIAEEAQRQLNYALTLGIGDQQTAMELYEEILARVTARVRFQTTEQAAFNDKVEEAGAALGLVVPGLDSTTGSLVGVSAGTEMASQGFANLTAEIDSATAAQKRFKEATPGSPFEGGFFEAVKPDGTTGVFNIEGEEFFGLRIGGEPVGRQERPTETVSVESPVSAGITPDLVSMDMSGIGARTMAGTSQPGNVTNINVNVSANSPLDAQEAGKNVVTALGRYQTTNGNVNTTLTGVGN